MNARDQKQLLIIDDHDAVRGLLNVFFKRDYDVEAKKDGLEALAWLSAGHIPDIILLDMQMPRLSGSDFLRQIRASGLFAHIPVLVITASDTSEALDETLELGVAGFIKKPFDPLIVRQKVADILAGTASTTVLSTTEKIRLDSAI